MALRGLSILQLPCTKILKKVLEDGAEKPGIDLHYFENQQEKFLTYQKQREHGGHPQPLGIGVLMWDEGKKQYDCSPPIRNRLIRYAYCGRQKAI